MGAVVIKLGSSIVAGDQGEVRTDVLSRICDELAELRGSGRQPVIVTSGAIARGMGVMGLPLRPRAMDELQAASAVGQGKLYQVYDELLRARGMQTAQVLLTFFDMSARSHYVNARQTLRKLLEWGVIPVINENDTTTTDEISFGDNDFLAAQVAILISAELLVLLTDADGLFTADPRTDPDARLVAEVTSFEQLDELAIGHATSALGLGRHALQGRGGRDGHRSRDPDRDRRRAATARAARRGRRRGGRHALRRARRALLELQAVAEVRQAHPRPGPRRRRRGAGAARGRAPACSRSGSSRCRASSTRATRSRSPSTGRWSARGSATTRRRSCGGSGG